MKATVLRTTLLGAAFVTVTVALASSAMADNKDRTYQVTIQNATLGQPLSPSVIATHTSGFELFDLGPAPTMGDDGYDLYFALATVAETGYPFHLQDELAAAGAVWDTAVLLSANTPPVLFPSESGSITISASGDAKYLSAASMLGMTNDAFWAVRGVELPRGVGDRTRVFANGYDAGSEANAESAATVGGGDGDNGATGFGINANGEGYIHVHAGIHGVGGAGGLDPALRDWRDPVVEVTIERIQ